MFAEKVWSDQTTLRAKSHKIESIKKVHNTNGGVHLKMLGWWI